MVSKRLGEYIRTKGISLYAFENTIGASRGSISKAIKDNKNIGSNVLENILIHYTDINLSWLLSGKGKMLLSDTNTANKDQTNYKIENNTADLKEIKHLKEVNQLLTDKNQLLIDKIECMEHLRNASLSREAEAKNQFPKVSFWMSEEKEKKKKK